jgi:GT2 family glycosyltransferase
MSLNPKVCIIILNWNGKELLKDCLSSIFKLTDYPNYKVIVVDNGSTDGSVEFVKKNFPQVNVLPLDKN